MEFQQVVDQRRMIRRYADRPVDPGAVQRALRNATRAPSAGFSQGWAFVLLDQPDDVRRYWEATTTPQQRESSSVVAASWASRPGRRVDRVRVRVVSMVCGPFVGGGGPGRGC